MTTTTSLSSEHDAPVPRLRCCSPAPATAWSWSTGRVPRDTNSTHSLVRGGVVQLARWGLLDEVVATGAPEIRTVSFHAGTEVTRRTVKDRAGVDFLLAPRRHVLDDVAGQGRRGLGAALLTGTTVTGVLRDLDGRVSRRHCARRRRRPAAPDGATGRRGGRGVLTDGNAPSGPRPWNGMSPARRASTPTSATCRGTASSSTSAIALSPARSRPTTVRPASG